MITDLPLKRISSIIVTEISRRPTRLTHKIAATNGGRRYETKLRHLRQRRLTEDRAVAVRNMHGKFGEVWTRGPSDMPADRHTDRQTDSLIAILRSLLVVH